MQIFMIMMIIFIVAIFIGIPLCNKLYAFLEPKIARLRGEK